MKVLNFFISLLIGVGLLVWIIQFVGWLEIKSAFLIFTGWQGIIIVLLTFLLLFVGSWKWQVILKSLGHNLSHRQLLPPYLVGFSMNYLFQMIIVGGEIFRTYILKEKYAVPWKKAVSSVIIDKILEVTCFILSVLAGLAFFIFKIGLPSGDIALIIGGFLFLLTAAIGFFYFKSFKKESIAKPLANFFRYKGLPNGDILEIEKETFSFFKLKKIAFWQGLGLASLRVAITWLRVWVLILFLGKGIGFLSSLSVLGFAYIAMGIPIPADLGVHEAIQVFAFNALGLGAGAAPAFAMIQRGAQLIIAFIGIIIFFKLGMGLFQAILFRKLDRLIGNKNNQT
ncbi:flippase-like domain-containing protein [Candidatus Microgenomates bacterium]|nr:flippase-like domain-containing protein [Candidatus Microgenomates bacterium]